MGLARLAVRRRELGTRSSTFRGIRRPEPQLLACKCNLSRPLRRIGFPKNSRRPALSNIEAAV